MNNELCNAFSLVDKKVFARSIVESDKNWASVVRINCACKDMNASCSKRGAIANRANPARWNAKGNVERNEFCFTWLNGLFFCGIKIIASGSRTHARWLSTIFRKQNNLKGRLHLHARSKNSFPNCQWAFAFWL